MKTLLLLRHAKSSKDDPNIADHDRPLNKRGQGDAPRSGQHLVDADLLPDLIFSSTSKRTRDTVELVVQASHYQGDILYSRVLYDAEPSDCLAALSNLPEKYQRVMLVGHNPGLEELLHLLTGQAQIMPTAALAEISLPVKTWSELGQQTRGILVSFWRP